GPLGPAPPSAAGEGIRAGARRVVAETQSPVTCLAWSPDGRRVAAGTEDGTVHIADAATGKEVGRFPTNGSLKSLAFSPDGKALALGQSGRGIEVWDIADGQQRKSGARV